MIGWLWKSKDTEIRVDDTWTYRILDGITHEPQGEVTHRVIEVAESEIVTQLRGSKSGKTSLRYFTRDWNILDAGELKSQITTWYAPAVRRFMSTAISNTS